MERRVEWISSNECCETCFISDVLFGQLCLTLKELIRTNPWCYFKH